MAIETKAIVKEIIPRTYNVKSVRIQPEQKQDFKAGQFLHLTLNEDKALCRYLSISNSPTEKNYLEFTKKITESEFSQVLDNLKPGDRVLVKYPMGNFTLDGKEKKIAFLSGGIGITPIRSICKYVVDTNSGTDIMLIYANRTAKDIAFSEDFAEMQKRYLRLKVAHILSQAESEWAGRKGYINAQVVKEEIPDYIERKFYLCGPPQMVEAMKKILIEELNLSKEKIATENFIGY